MDQYYESIDAWIQIPICVGGIVYMILLACRGRKYRHMGHWVVFSVQPLWFFTTLYHGQPGVFLISLVYFFVSMFGIWNTRKTTESKVL